jgi:hypothetical protein
MARMISEHRIGELNEELIILVDDEPGHRSKACHKYRIMDQRELCVLGHILFQNGTLAERGTNGITNEALLAIVIDRLRGFQAGEFACRENAAALARIEEALVCPQGQPKTGR